MGTTALRKIQIGEEATKGTAVPATAVLRGALTMKSVPTIHQPVEERGSFAAFARSVNVGNLAELTYEGDATFEQILYLLHMGVLGNVTATGAGAAKEWVFTPAMTAAGVFDAFTIEYGDDVEQWEVEFCMAKLIEFSGVMNEPVMMSGDIFGRKMTVANFTSSLSAPTVESILTQKCRLYIDDESGAIGATEKASTLISFNYVINTGLLPKRYGDGEIDFSNYAEGFKGVDLRITFAFNAGAEVERLLYDGATKRLIRIEAVGTQAQADEDSGDTVQDNPLAQGATELNVVSGGNFAVDQVIKIESERLLITAIVTNALTVVRGYEGTTDASHVTSTTINLVHDKRLRLDFCGIYDAWETLADRDGEDVVDVTLIPQRGTNYTKLFEVEVVNTVATLP